MRALRFQDPTDGSRGHSLWLAGTALFALLWLIARAVVQAVTIDEADTYVVFVARSGIGHWSVGSNNHLLNSALMSLFTTVLGASPFTVRLPALIGAAVYIYSAYLWCTLIARELMLRWVLLLCLVVNPFVMDYLVAARGYSLAMAFLVCAIGLAARYKLEASGNRTLSRNKMCAMCSALIGLSFTANFSFAFVVAAALLMIFLWVLRDRGPKDYARTVSAIVLPGLLVALFLSSSILMRWSRAEFTYGATSLGETFSSIADSCLYELNPNIVNPLLYPAFQKAVPFLLPLLGAGCLCRMALIFLNRSSITGWYSQWMIELGIVLALITGTTVLIHWLSFQLLQLVLPKERTAIYFVPLGTLMVGVIAALPHLSRMDWYGRRAAMVMLSVWGFYFLLYLRLGYFKEWKFDADVNTAYQVLSYYNHRYGVKDVPSHWRYASSLNFYREISRHETFLEFQHPETYPLDKQVFVLSYPDDQPFVEKNRLKEVYEAERSTLAVAIRPELEASQPR